MNWNSRVLSWLGRPAMSAPMPDAAPVTTAVLVGEGSGGATRLSYRPPRVRLAARSASSGRLAAHSALEGSPGTKKPGFPEESRAFS